MADKPIPGSYIDTQGMGAPLSPEEIYNTKEKLGLDPDNFFDLPKEVLDECLGVDLHILGSGGYAAAVITAARDLGYNPNIITRNNWNEIKEIRDSIIFNCTPVENIEVDKANNFIDCIVSTPTGKRLAWIQAYHQFKLYTNKDLPIRSV